MSKTIWAFVDEGAGHDTPTRWLSRKEGTVVHGAAASLEAIPEADRYRLILAAPLVRTVAVVPPAKRNRLFIRSLPGMVEEKTLLPIERIHATPGPVADSRCPVHIVDASLLRATLDRFARAGVAVDGVYAESDLFAASVNRPALLLYADAVLFVGKESPVLLDRPTDGSPPVGLKRLLNEEEAEAVELHRYVGAGPTDEARWSETIGRTVVETGVWSWEKGIDLTDRVTNLLSGPFAPPPKWIARVTQFSGSLPIFTGLMGALVVSLLIQWGALAAEKDDLKKRMRTTLTETFPEVTVVVDPATQMRQKVDTLQEEVRLSRPSAPMFLATVDILKTVAAQEAGLVGVAYDEGRLTLTVVDADPGAVAALQAALPGVTPRMTRRDDGATEFSWPTTGERR